MADFDANLVARAFFGTVVSSQEVRKQLLISRKRGLDDTARLIQRVLKLEATPTPEQTQLILSIMHPLGVKTEREFTNLFNTEIQAAIHIGTGKPEPDPDPEPDL